MGTKLTQSDEAESFAALEAIAATLQKYIEAARTGDGRVMRCAFLETARIRGTYDGKPVDWTLMEFCSRIDQGGPTSALTARIVHVDRAGMAADARVEVADWRGTRYTDFFVLLQIDGSWRIASKVFFAHSRA